MSFESINLKILILIVNNANYNVRVFLKLNTKSISQGDCIN